MLTVLSLIFLRHFLDYFLNGFANFVLFSCKLIFVSGFKLFDHFLDIFEIFHRLPSILS